MFEAHTNPDLVRRWLLVPGGWTMTVCEIALRVVSRGYEPLDAILAGA